MYHSITFGEKNTWDDWHLIPSSAPMFLPPLVKTKLIDVPGINGQLDLLDLLLSAPTYGNRVGSFQFIVANGYFSWDHTYSMIMNYLHGRSIQAVLEDDPLYFYSGRFTVNEWQSGKTNSVIAIDYNVSPVKQLVAGD